MKHVIPGCPPKGGAEKYRCAGSAERMELPSNRYHPQQVAWLTERHLYTGRMIADIAFLPEELKHL